MTNDQYMTRKEVEDITGMSAATILNRQRQGLLHPIKSNRDQRLNLYSRAEVEALTAAITKSA